MTNYQVPYVLQVQVAIDEEFSYIFLIVRTVFYRNSKGTLVPGTSSSATCTA